MSSIAFPSATGAIERFSSTASDRHTAGGGSSSSSSSHCGRYDDDDDDRRRRLHVQVVRRRQRDAHRRFEPYPPVASRSVPMFKRGGFFPSSSAVRGDQPVAGAPPSFVPLPPSVVPMPPPPPPPAAEASAFNLQFAQQPPPTGFSGFASEHHGYYHNQQQFPYTFSSASPPTYSWANTNSTDIMKFTGSSNPRPLDTSVYHVSNFGSVPKRKIDLDSELPQPPKMRITEEKVSASLRDMHISNKFQPHNYCISASASASASAGASTSASVSDMDMIAEDLSPSSVINASDSITQTETKTTLFMCEELRKLNKIDSIIPQPLLNVDRPTNAVMVWKPKPVVEVVHSIANFHQEPESTVVITEITDEEENEINNEDEMFVENDNTISIEDDDMEL